MSFRRALSWARGEAKRRRVALQLVTLALVCLFWALYVAQIWGQLSTYSWEWSLGPLLCAFALWFVYTLAQALGWVATCVSIGGNTRMPPAARVWLLSMPARYVPGNVWHVLSRIYMGGQIGLEPGTILLSSTIEQGMMIVGPLIVFLLSLAAWADRIDRAFVLLVLLIPIGLGCLHPRILRPLIGLASRMSRKPAPEVDLRYGSILAIAGWYAALHLVSGIASYLIVASLAPVALADAPALIGAYSLAYVVGYLSFLTPGGLGVREAVLLGLLSIVVPAPVAAASSLLARALSTAGELACITIMAWLWRTPASPADSQFDGPEAKPAA
jgi:glycosyltransferase 2 family protein